MFPRLSVIVISILKSKHRFKALGFLCLLSMGYGVLLLTLASGFAIIKGVNWIEVNLI